MVEMSTMGPIWALKLSGVNTTVLAETALCNLDRLVGQELESKLESQVGRLIQERLSNIGQDLNTASL
jgi:hypothetical protein